MKLNNKGFIPTFFVIAFSLTALAVVWHIPAWTQAKHDHTEASYQSQVMWPQVQINQLANPIKGNGGNFAGGNSGAI